MVDFRGAFLEFELLDDREAADDLDVCPVLCEPEGVFGVDAALFSLLFVVLLDGDVCGAVLPELLPPAPASPFRLVIMPAMFGELTGGAASAGRCRSGDLRDGV